MRLILATAATGFRKMVALWRVCLALLLVSFLFALIPTLLVSNYLEESLENSGAAEKMAEGYDDQWFQEYEASASGLAAEFEPSVLGVGAALGAFDSFLAGKLWQSFSPVTALGLGYVVLWIFLGGGVLEALGRPGRTGFPAFVAASGMYFFRFLRITLVIAVFYLVLYRYVFPWFDEWTALAIRDVTDERVGFLWTLLKYALTLLLLIQLAILSDYARILTVLQSRRRVLGALFAAIRFELRHPLKVWGIYLLFAVMGGGMVLLYWTVAPGAGQTTWGGVSVALAMGQIYILTRIGGRLWLWATEIQLTEALGTVPTRTSSAGNRECSIQEKPVDEPGDSGILPFAED